MFTYQIIGSGTIRPQYIGGQVRIITEIYDAVREIRLRTGEHPTIWRNIYPNVGFLTVASSNYYPTQVEDGIRILSLAVIDGNENLIIEYEIPENEVWACSVEFARKNRWI